MATIDGRPAQYGISLKHLRELMEHRGADGIGKIQEFGGTQEICKKLYTSASEGKKFIGYKSKGRRHRNYQYRIYVVVIFLS